MTNPDTNPAAETPGRRALREVSTGPYLAGRLVGLALHISTRRAATAAGSRCRGRRASPAAGEFVLGQHHQSAALSAVLQGAHSGD